MKVDRRGYIYLGTKYAGDEFQLAIEASGFVLRLEKVVKIPARDAWFFDPKWQRAEQKVQHEIDEGKSKRVDDVVEYLSKVRKRKKKT